MRIIPLVILAAACLLTSNLGAQTVARAIPRAAVAPQVEASIRAIPRPVLRARNVVHLREDRTGFFTPANLKGVSQQDLAKGRVIGVAKLSASNALGVPAGTYDYVVMKSDNKWHLYAVSGGRVVKEARQVRVQTVKPSGFHPKLSASSGSRSPQLGSLILDPDTIKYADTVDAATSYAENGYTSCQGVFQHIAVTGIDSHGHRGPVAAKVEHYTYLPGKAYGPHDSPDIEPAATMQPDGSWSNGSWAVGPFDIMVLYKAGEGWVDVSPICLDDRVRFTAPGYAVAYLHVTLPPSTYNPNPDISWGW